MAFPDWWEWEVELTPHVEKRMEDRGFDEVDLRTMLQRARRFRPDVVTARFVLETQHEGHRLERRNVPGRAHRGESMRTPGIPPNGNGERSRRSGPAGIRPETLAAASWASAGSRSARSWGKSVTAPLLPRGRDHVVAWGNNTYGQLGNGTREHAQFPVSTLLGPATAISAGASSSFAVTGEGNVRQTGLLVGAREVASLRATSLVPELVEDPCDPSGLLSSVTTVTAGAYHAVAGPTLRSWGDGTVGQSGGLEARGAVGRSGDRAPCSADMRSGGRTAGDALAAEPQARRRHHRRRDGPRGRDVSIEVTDVEVGTIRTKAGGMSCPNPGTSRPRVTG